MGQRRMRTIQIALTATLLLAGMLIQHPSVKAQEPTYVHGEIQGTWNIEGSPYVVIEDVLVPNEWELTIEPGVEVRFHNNTGMFVHGRLVVAGAEGFRVNFTSNATEKSPGLWDGIVISVDSDENLIEFAKVEYATYGIRCTDGSSVTISHSEFLNNSVGGIEVVASSAYIEDSRISNSHVGLQTKDSEIMVKRTEISHNSDLGLGISYSFALMESIDVIGNDFGLSALGSEVYLFNSSIQSTVNAMSMDEASRVTTMDSFLSKDLVEIKDISSTLVIQWSLRVRVLDMFYSGAQGATVTIEGALVDTMTFHSGEEGWIETLIVRELVKTRDEEVIYNPYYVNATKYGYEDNDEVFVIEPRTVSLRVLVDLIDPNVDAGPDLTVSEDEEIQFDVGESTDNDPDFLTTGTFEWTFYDYDGHTKKVGATVSHVFHTPGKYSVRLRAEDSFGNWGEDFLEVLVEDITDPVAVASVEPEVKIGEVLVLNASASTDNDPEFSDTGNYTWKIDLGDDEVVLYGEIVEYTFGRSGTHSVQLEVRDAYGNSATDQIEVEVLKKPEEFPYLPVLAVALVGIAFAGAANTEAGKYWFFKFLIIPLYVKLSKKDILDHFIRGQIYGYLVVNPGENYTTIKRNLDLKNGTLTYHLDVLEREGFIKSQLKGTKRHYYPKGVKMPDNGTGFPAIKEDIVRRVEETPGISISDLASLLGVSRQLTNYHLKGLVQDGYVQVERRGIRTRCYPAERHSDR